MFLSHFTLAQVLLILTLLIFMNFRMKESGQAKEPVRFVWDSDGPSRAALLIQQVTNIIDLTQKKQLHCTAQRRFITITREGL